MVKKERQELFQHFSKSEQDFVEKMDDVCQRVELTYAFALTNFVNPREEEIIRMLANRYQLSCFSTRDWLAAEYARVIVAPDYYSPVAADFEMTAYHIEYPQEYYRLTHAQILGTLLHTLSIRREFIGDIIIGEQEALVLLAKPFGVLVEQEVKKIAKAPVRFIEKDWTSLVLSSSEEGQERVLLVSSVRLDKLVAAGFGLSRSKASQLIEKGKVKVNYQGVEQPSQLVTIGSLISARGFGRMEIHGDLGFSKQGKIKLKVNIIKK